METTLNYNLKFSLPNVTHTGFCCCFLQSLHIINLLVCVYFVTSQSTYFVVILLPHLTFIYFASSSIRSEICTDKWEKIGEMKNYLRNGQTKTVHSNETKLCFV